MLNSSPLSSPPRPGRPADRQDLIVEELRQLIVGGELQPGSRLPTRPEIEGRYGAGTSTVQRALDKLKQDGFITSNGRNGTFVVPNPPHLTRYALVFSQRPTIRAWSRYWTALVNEAQELERTTDLQIPIYYEVDGHSDSPGYQRLIADVHNHRIAGIIFPERPYMLENTPLWQMVEAPRVTAGHDLPFQHETFWERACEFLAARGRKRVAILTMTDVGVLQDIVVAQLERFGLETQPYWWQVPGASHPSSARNAVHMLFHPNQISRPDALIVGDDNLVEAATAGLLAAGVQSPQDLDVVAYTNFPWSPNALVPVHHLGYHARQILKSAITMIDAQRQNKPLQEKPTMTAKFEWEFEEQL